MRQHSKILFLLLFAVIFAAIGTWSFDDNDSRTCASQPFEESNEQEEKESCFDEDFESDQVSWGDTACGSLQTCASYRRLTIELACGVKTVLLDFVSARPPPVALVLFS